MTLHLGCIADDFTGATDLANNLVRAGMRVVQINGLPQATTPAPQDVDAIVIALKSRTIAAQEAVEQSLAALKWLQKQGCRRIYYKVCSTFDSTPLGNIGPVAEALMDALDCEFSVATPAFPDNKRTVFKGYLFAGDGLLSESGMQNHPLTPMTDANLVRVLQAQSKSKVGLVDYTVVAQGEAAIRARFAQLKASGVRLAIVDAISNADLMRLGSALSDMSVVTAGSGVAIGLPQNYGIAPSSQASQLPKKQGLRAVISGSCSVATNWQVRHAIGQGMPAFAIDPLKLIAGEDVAKQALDWAQNHTSQSTILIYSTAEPESVKAAQSQRGVQETGDLVEQCLAHIAKALVQRGVGQLVVAGGETSGACVQALQAQQMRIGPQIDPGVPWCHAATPHSKEFGAIHIALKSGNFGTEDFFTKAFELI
jgi:3-dehydrotetronate 4-kinase